MYPVHYYVYWGQQQLSHCLIQCLLLSPYVFRPISSTGSGDHSPFLEALYLASRPPYSSGFLSAQLTVCISPYFLTSKCLNFSRLSPWISPSLSVSLSLYTPSVMSSFRILNTFFQLNSSVIYPIAYSTSPF